ncbi:MAG: hypothetical protein ABI811_05165 [Acidobacteriota bacterium]
MSAAAQPAPVPSRRLLCPRCRSPRIHRSHRRTFLDRVLAGLGAEIRRCHDCRFRRAFWTDVSLPLGPAHDSSLAPTHLRTQLGIFLCAFTLCIGFLWLVITRFTGS